MGKPKPKAKAAEICTPDDLTVSKPRTALLRIVLKPGTGEDQEFDLERVTRRMLDFGDVHIDALRPSTAAERRGDSALTNGTGVSDGGE